MNALDLAGRRLVVVLTGGIACYKVAELVRRLQDHGATIDVVMTDAATRFITPVTLQALSGRPVFVDAWDSRPDNNMAHINLTRGADAIVVAPASTDFLFKLAHGVADDLASTLCVARACPLLVAPAMNREMWLNPATQRNVALLRGDGVHFLGPGSGAQACGETGDGRMLEPPELLAGIISFFQPKVLAGRKVVLTAGPTAEPIDPVRVLTNHSSGKMGYALARAAAEAGAEVVLVSGPTALDAPFGVSRVSVQTATEMLAAVERALPGSDAFIAVAAVADWRPVAVSTSKLKKDAQGTPPPLQLEPNPDILATVAAGPQPPYCVGFAAETEDLEHHASAKRLRKGVPLLVGNIAQDSFGAEDTSLVLFDDSGSHPLPRLSKLAAARRLIQELARRLP